MDDARSATMGRLLRQPRRSAARHLAGRAVARADLERTVLGRLRRAGGRHLRRAPDRHPRRGQPRGQRRGDRLDDPRAG